MKIIKKLPPKVNLYNLEKRASRIALCRPKAGLTLEAALILPIFLAAVVAVMFIINVLTVQTRLLKAIYNQAMKMSGYAYFLNVIGEENKAEKLFEAAYVKNQVIKELGEEYLDNTLIRGGHTGIHIVFANILEDGIVDFRLHYKMEIPFNILDLPPFEMGVRVRFRTWIGESDEEKEEKKSIVYVTKNGTVYHTQEDCTYIKKEILSCGYNEISSQRNLSGAKYYLCELCQKHPKTEQVYYTQYGTRYHYDKMCRNINANVFTMMKKDAMQSYRLCSKCKENMLND